MNELIELAKKQEIELEINKTTSKSTEINILNGDEHSFEIKNNTTYLIKGIKEKKCVRIVTENLDSPIQILSNLENILNIQENESSNQLSNGVIKGEKRFFKDVDFQKIKEELLSLEELKKTYPIYSFEIMYGFLEENNKILNTNANLENNSFFHQLGVSITLKKEKILKNFNTYYYTKEYDIKAFRKYLITELEILNVKLNSSSCQTNKYNLILKNNVVADILESFSSMFFTKNIELKESALTHQFGKKVFSEKISIVEDPRSKNAFYEKLFDCEGTPTTFKEIVKNGVFIKKINDLEYAKKSKEDPTGNADGVHHLLIKPGDLSEEKLISKLWNGIIIDTVMGLHSGINIHTGDISLQAEGLLVEEGKIVSGLSQIIITTTIFEIFNSILEIGNVFSTNNLEVVTPSLLVENITIAGEK